MQSHHTALPLLSILFFDLVTMSTSTSFWVCSAWCPRFFRDVFDLNRGTAVEQNEKKNGFPVIPLMDDSKTLRLLLDFFHPRVEEPQLDDVTLFWNVSKQRRSTAWISLKAS